MSKVLRCFSCLAICMLFLCSCTLSEDAMGCSVGMSRTKFGEIVPEVVRFDYLEYSFFADDNGNNCVVRFDKSGDGSIAEVRIFPSKSTDVSAESFASIHEGMTLFEVVEKVGLPTGTATFGFASLVFAGDEGDYVIVIEPMNDPVSVVSVELRTDP